MGGEEEKDYEEPAGLEYSNMSQREIQKLTDDALDAGDIETVRTLAKYLKEEFNFDFLD